MASARILHSRSLLHHTRCHTSFGTRQQRHVYIQTRLQRDVKKRVGSGKTTELGRRLDFGANAALHIGHPKSRLLSVKTLPLVVGERECRPAQLPVGHRRRIIKMRVFDHDLGEVFLGGIDLSYVPSKARRLVQEQSIAPYPDDGLSRATACLPSARTLPLVVGERTARRLSEEQRAVSSEQRLPSARTLPLVIGERTAGRSTGEQRAASSACRLPGPYPLW
ncbi:hypothetical protein KC340_g6412 [Hortaea werneckii]|nr:hypothetical protein KC342_g6699 [Hortaea werneckii]KAI7240693.1 hypothetical protein KC365_g3737 [Hortaea werneckii]KAI7324409.1 hypothetical protein KC340_g6412 [Hortaea werneckii]KAI7399880.1 hypothetical protein KC328_g3836 [Hortaea werneckii]